MFNHQIQQYRRYYSGILQVDADKFFRVKVEWILDKMRSYDVRWWICMYIEIDFTFALKLPWNRHRANKM